MALKLRFKKLHPDAIIPSRANPGDAGLDLYALEDVVLQPTTRDIAQARVRTGIAVEIPEGHYGKVSSRSGLAFNHGIFSFDGTIDSGYRGEIGVLLYNTTDRRFRIRKGDRIAQLLIIPCIIADPVEVEELTESIRGANGFGSSGR